MTRNAILGEKLGEIQRYLKQNVQAVSATNSAPKGATKVQQKLKQKVHNNYVALLIKQFVFIKSVECIC